MSNYLDPYFDAHGPQRDPLDVLAEMISQERRVSQAMRTAWNDLDVGHGEDLVMGLCWSALCLAAGLEESASDRVAWRLHCLGALECATFFHGVDDAIAPFAWPEEKLALMLTFGRAADFTVDEERDAVFRQNGWLVLRVDPTCSTLDVQLECVADLVLALQSEVNAAS